MADFTKHIVELETCESTNDVAMEMVRLGCPHGTAVITQIQTRGKGRLGRAWESFRGNLAMSVVIRPHQLPTYLAPRLVMLSAHAVILALRARGVETWIKWPNDILIKKADSVEKLGRFRKLGGILLELSSANNMIEAAVIGIGLNLKTPAKEEVGKIIPQMGFVDVPAREFADELLKQLEKHVARPIDDAFFNEVLTDIKHNLAFMNEEVVVDNGSTPLRGIVSDISHDCALMIKDESGVIKSIYVGDVFRAA